MARQLGSKASVLSAFTDLSELMHGLLDAPHAVQRILGDAPAS